MNQKEMLGKTGDLLEQAKIAVLATVDKNDVPHMRWMTPCVLDQYPGFLYAVTSQDFTKVQDLEHNSNVQWMIQTRTLSDIITLNGIITVIDNPSLKTEVLEKIGRNLQIFWKNREEKSTFVVLETRILSVGYFEPISAKREFVKFPEE